MFHSSLVASISPCCTACESRDGLLFCSPQMTQALEKSPIPRQPFAFAVYL